MSDTSPTYNCSGTTITLDSNVEVGPSDGKALTATTYGQVPIKFRPMPHPYSTPSLHLRIPHQLSTPWSSPTTALSPTRSALIPRETTTLTHLRTSPKTWIPGILSWLEYWERCLMPRLQVTSTSPIARHIQTTISPGASSAPPLTPMSHQLNLRLLRSTTQTLTTTLSVP